MLRAHHHILYISYFCICILLSWFVTLLLFLLLLLYPPQLWPHPLSSGIPSSSTSAPPLQSHWPQIESSFGSCTSHLTAPSSPLTLSSASLTTSLYPTSPQCYRWLLLLWSTWLHSLLVWVHCEGDYLMFLLQPCLLIKGAPLTLLLVLSAPLTSLPLSAKKLVFLKLLKEIRKRKNLPYWRHTLELLLLALIANLIDQSSYGLSDWYWHPVSGFQQLYLVGTDPLLLLLLSTSKTIRWA